MGGGRRTTAKARVLIISDRSLFGEGIEGLLREEPGMELVGLETDRARAVERIKDTAPDVIILTDGEAATGYASELIGMVREGFRIRVVEVHLTTNTVCLYSGERQSIREVRDLVDTVGNICDALTRDAQVPLALVKGEPGI